MRRTIVSLAFAPIALACGAGAGGPIQPLTEITRQLETGVNDVLGGKDATESFGALQSSVMPTLIDQLREIGATAVRMVGMEFELVFYEGGSANYYLRTFVHPTRRGPAFASFEGRIPSGFGVSVENHPLDRFTGVATPLATAAEGLIATLTSGDCSALLIPTWEELASLVPPDQEESSRGNLARTAETMAQACATVAGLTYDRVNLRVDDVVFAALNADGEVVGGIAAGLELDDGVLTFEMGRLRRM